MSGQHTPGPWCVDALEDGRPFRIAAPYESSHRPGGIVHITRWGAITFPSSDEGKANARLIAAAPDMLIGLESALWALDNAAAIISAHGLESTIADPRPDIRFVIAKARGQT